MVNTHIYHLDSSYILLYVLYDTYIYYIYFTIWYIYYYYIYSYIYPLSIPLFVLRDYHYSILYYSKRLQTM